MMNKAQLGMWSGILDATTTPMDVKGGKKKRGSGGVTFAGVSAWLIWRSAYWTKSVSTANKILIPMYW